MSLLSDGARDKYNGVKSWMAPEMFLKVYNAQKNSFGDETYLSKSRAVKQAIDRELKGESAERKKQVYRLFNVSEKVW